MKRIVSLGSGLFLVLFPFGLTFSQDDQNSLDRVRNHAAKAQQELDRQEGGSTPAPARPRPQPSEPEPAPPPPKPQTTPESAPPAPTKTAIVYISPGLKGGDKTDAEDRAWQEEQALRKQGYKVIEKKADEQAILDDLWNGVDAIAFFGHGGTDVQGNAASTFAGRTAQGWQSSLFSDFRLRYIHQGLTLEQAEAKTKERLRNLGIKMMRNFSCRSLHDKDIAKLFVSPGGKYYGVPSTLTGGPIAQTVSDYSPGFCSGLFGYSFELTLYVVGEDKPAPGLDSETEVKPTPAPALPPAPAEAVKAIRYEIEKVTGNDSAGLPRDTAPEKTGELGISGSIPLSYSESWETGFANMNGAVTLSAAAPGANAQPKEVWVTVAAQASWSNKGLGYGRPTGIFISGSESKEAKDYKGVFDNGSTSAAASWSGPLADGITVRIIGKENKIVTLRPIRP